MAARPRRNDSHARRARALGALPLLKLHPNLIACVTLFLAGCTSLPEKPGPGAWPYQIARYEVTPFDTVYKAFKAVLQEEGYILKMQDVNSGVLVAELGQRLYQSAGVVLSAERIGRAREITINVNKLPQGKSEARVSLQLVRNYSMGGSSGDELLDRPYYDEVFALVKAELDRRASRRPDSKVTKPMPVNFKAPASKIPKKKKIR